MSRGKEDGGNTVDSANAGTASVNLPAPGSIYRRRQGERRSTPKKSPAFGDEALHALYRQTKHFIVTFQMLRIVQVVSLPAGGKRVIICNFWRIDRLADGRVRFAKRNLHTGRWRATVSLKSVPAVPLLPIRNTRGLNWWMVLIRQMVHAVAKATGYQRADPPLKVRKVEWVLEKLVTHYIGCSERPGFLDRASMERAARALRAALFQNVLERELASVAVALRPNQVDLWFYLKLALHREAVLRVARERRNLLPWLLIVPTAHWQREDLFARHLWGPGQEGIRWVQSRYPNFSGFESAASFRWLCRARFTVVNCWCYQGMDTNILDMIVRCQVQARVPAVFWCFLIKHHHSFVRLGQSIAIQRLIRALAQYCAERWVSAGYQVLRRELNCWALSNSFLEVVDWLCFEGLEQGQPAKQASWGSLRRRSAAWHERQTRQRTEIQNLQWVSPLGETCQRDFLFRPLTSSAALWEEGDLLHHCVGNFDEACFEGRYLVFAVEGPAGSRSTLGLVKQQGCWHLDEHTSYYNEPVSLEAEEAGIALLEAVRQLDKVV
ncbi:PcfJ domain-containing protein [Parachitinimonas caeni]|uniref:PcfJ domain-containing protein n=1 Tax=Parachitinimonas caeni TaxID=3031301 RepID=A0ABT7E353_9NEIS|nr:PcfJ domain-containing protein [Parachitinimonas caeni]MDK2126474.1 PcfJ domain-containing protein [Parachitinimonas caeni]